jgi:hypothetical protein
MTYIASAAASLLYESLSCADLDVLYLSQVQLVSKQFQMNNETP